MKYTMSCPIKVNSNTIELTVHTSCYCVLDLLCVKTYKTPQKIKKILNHSKEFPATISLLVSSKR